MIARQESKDLTRQRLLDAAGEVFAEHGFKNATVRQICGRAGANIAAINYHFGDKQRLYSAAVKYAHDCAKGFPLDEGVVQDSLPQQRLRAFVRGFLRGILAEGRPAWHGRLVAREMNEPTGVLDEIVAQSIRPRFELLASILRAMFGADAPPQLIQRCAQSIVGQILFYHFAAPVLTRLFPQGGTDSSDVDTLAEHITTFSMAGLRSLMPGGPS